MTCWLLSNIASLESQIGSKIFSSPQIAIIIRESFIFRNLESNMWILCNKMDQTPLLIYHWKLTNNKICVWLHGGNPCLFNIATVKPIEIGLTTTDVILATVFTSPSPIFDYWKVFVVLKYFQRQSEAGEVALAQK